MPCQHLRLFSLANQNQAVISVAEKLGLYSTHTHTVTALAFFSQLGAKKKDSKKESSKNIV